MNKDRVTRLMELGLTEYESRAYLALLDLESSEASQVADVARVPRTKIYSALEGLEGRTLVKVVPVRPKRYIVQPIGNLVDRLEAEHRQRARDLESSRAGLESEFKAREGAETPQAGSFLALRGRSNLVSRSLELLERAERSVLVVTSAPGLERLAYHDDILQDLVARGVTVRVLAPLHQVDPDALRTLEGLATLRQAPAPTGPSTLVLVDGSRALLMHHVPDDHHIYQGTDLGLFTDDGGLACMLQNLAAAAMALGASAGAGSLALESVLAEAADVPGEVPA